MKITFSGNHIYKMKDMDSIIKHMDNYFKCKEKNNGRMIIYSNDDYIHVIDGIDYVNFRKAEAINKGLLPITDLFKKLTAAYREKATIVDFSDL